MAGAWAREKSRENHGPGTREEAEDSAWLLLWIPLGPKTGCGIQAPGSVHASIFPNLVPPLSADGALQPSPSLGLRTVKQTPIKTLAHALAGGTNAPDSLGPLGKSPQGGPRTSSREGPCCLWMARGPEPSTEHRAGLKA